MNRPNHGWLTTAAQASAIPVLILTSTGLGLLLGWWLDDKLGTGPWLAIGLTMLGLISGLYESVRILIRITRGSGD